MYEFIETSIFTRQVAEADDEGLLEAIQTALANNPEAGAALRSGMRKMRVRSPKRGEGKRGGYRVFYYFTDKRGVIFLIWLLDKKDAESLNPRQELEALRIVKAIQAEV